MNCVPLEMVPGMMATIMEKAGVPKALRAKVLGLLSEERFLSDGRVLRVISESGRKVVTVIDSTGYGALTLDFPPNAQEFDAELTRAQNNNARVDISYRVETGTNNNIIDILTVGQSW